MESRVIFRDGMDLDPADFNNLQSFTQASLDDLVLNLGTDERKFSGFNASSSSVTEVTVTPGILWSAGKAYKRETEFLHDFTTVLPVATKRIALISVWGQEIDTDNRPREFLINEETGESEPRVVSMERARIANIGVTLGSESADPVAPTLDVGVLSVVRVVLTPAGIESVSAVAANKIESIKSLDSRVASVESFRDATGPQIVALSSDLSAIKNSAIGKLNLDEYADALRRLAAVEARFNVPSTAVSAGVDFFLDRTATDEAASGYSALVSEGVRFATAANSTTTLTLFDPQDPRVVTIGGMMLPAYSAVGHFGNGYFPSGEMQVSSYSYQTIEFKQKGIAPKRYRFGESFNISSSSTWWKSGVYDYDTMTFRRAGETYQVINATRKVGYNDIVRVTRFWVDEAEGPYWDRVITPTTKSGSTLAQVFLNPSDAWATHVNFCITRYPASGTYTYGICGVNNDGSPNTDDVLAIATRDVTTLVGTETGVNGSTAQYTSHQITPVLLEAGKRYAVFIITGVDLWVATTTNDVFPQGTLFYMQDGRFQQANSSIDLSFSIGRAKFAASRTVVTLQPLSLSGGISSLDLTLDAIVPKSTNLAYEINTGTGWRTLEPGDSSLTDGSTMPGLAQLRLVMLGTVDMAPGLKMSNAQAIVARPNTSFTHFSATRTVPSTTQVRVVARLESFDAGFHTASCSLMTGAGFTTANSASSSSDVTNADGSIERTWVFNLGSAVTAYKIRLSGTTTNALRLFHMAWRKDYTL